MTMNNRSPWWDRDGKHPLWGSALATLVTAQFASQSQRYLNMRKYCNCYEYGYKAIERAGTKERYLDDTVLSFNAAQNAIDTVVSQVCTAKTLPMVLTEGGTWDQRDLAKKASKAVEGLFSELGIDRIREDTIRDFAKCGGGFTKVYADSQSGVIAVDRILPFDILFDEAETRYGKPRCTYLRVPYDRFVLLDAYGSAEEGYAGTIAARRTAIEKAAGSPEWLDHGELGEDTVWVIEAWHLPSRAPRGEDKGSQDGRHSIVLTDGTPLLDEEWAKPRVPIAKYIAKRSTMGVWGIPPMRQLASGQREFEVMSQKLQRSHKRMGGVHMLSPKGAKVSKRALIGDAIADIWEYEGQQAPTSIAPDPANPQSYTWHQMMPEMMLKFIGTSGFSAQSQVPAGLSQASGKALQTFEEQENKRFIEWYREDERWTVEVSDLMLDAAEELSAEDPEFASRYRSNYGYETIKWSQIVKDRHSLVLRTFPVSALSSSPSAKFAQLTELLNSGAITIEQFKRLYGMPDLEAENDVDLADQEIIDKNLDYMVTTGKYLAPEGTDSLALIVNRGAKFYNMLRRYEVPEDRKLLIMQYIDDAQKMLAESAAPAPPSGAPPQMNGAV